MHLNIRKTSIVVLFLIAAISQVNALELTFQNDKTEIRLSQLDQNTAKFEISIQNISIEAITLPQGEFTQLNIPGFHRTLETGVPQLPSMNRLIELPQGDNFQVSLIYSETETLNLRALGFDAPVFPAQPSLAKNIDPNTVPFLMNDDLYTEDNYLDQEQLQLDMLGQMRDANIGLLKIQPVEYNPVTGELRIHHRLKLQIDLSQSDWPLTQTRKSQKQTAVFSVLHRQITSLVQQDGVREDLVTAPIKMAIVAHSMFSDALQPFIQWKQRQGYTIIEGYLGEGDLGSTSTSIENWLTDLYNGGTAEDPAPSFVLLVGDRAQVPAPNGNHGSHVTDRYYAEVTGDMLPDMYLGRFPAASVSQLEAMIAKTLMYEQYTMTDPSYLGEVVMIAGMDGTFGPTHGNGQINYGTQHYFNPEHGILSHTYLYPVSGSSAAAIRADLSAGVAFANYTAHGSATTWHDPYLSISNVNALTNSQAYFTAIANACLTAKFDTPECIGEAFLRAPDKGAIGYIGGTNSTYWDEDYYWGVGNGPVVPSGATYEQTSWGMYDGLFHDHGEPESEWTITNSAMVYRGNLAVTESSSSRANYYWEIYQLFGDPSLMTYMGVPETASVSVPDAVVMGSSEIVISAPPFCYASLNINNANITAVQVDGMGNATLFFDPTDLIPGVAELVVTGQNLQPWFGEINIITPDGAYLIVDHIILDDSPQGNGNGQADFGETLDIYFTLHNVGVDTAYNVIGDLSTWDPYVTTLIQAAQVDLLAPDSTVAQGPFTIMVGSDCPDNHLAELSLSLMAGLGQWTADFELLLRAPHVVMSDILVNDDDNHRLDIGESTILTLSMENQGGSDLSTLQVTLSSDDGYITLPDAPVILYDLLSSELQVADFAISVIPATPVEHNITFNWLATGDLGYTAQGQFRLVAGLIVEDFESGNFSAFDWELAGHVDWLVQSQDVFEGNYAAYSGNVGDSQNAELSLILDVTEPGDLSFMYKVSSESSTSGYYDGLKFFMDGALVEQWQGEISWTEASYAVTPGLHEFSWKYEKDGSVSHGSDCAWIDFVIMPPTSSSGGGLGDLNSDGQVNIQDVVRLVNIILGQGAEPTDLELFYADLNGDDRVDIGDLVSMVNIIIGGNQTVAVELINKSAEIRIK
ncbi:MAG: C25 family cysteine peptidase [Candidatus Marinimicrobia bacterium]|nr:C25 family cysteine peptidase [Candidatus Neomarinimicrobiota bacterium]